MILKFFKVRSKIKRTLLYLLKKLYYKLYKYLLIYKAYNIVLERIYNIKTRNINVMKV